MTDPAAASQAQPQAQPWAIEMRGIVKRFPGVVANDGIDLLVRTRWITKEQGEEIKLLPRGDQQAADQLLQQYQIELG